MYQLIRSIFLALIFLNTNALYSVQTERQHTPIRTEPVCWHGHAISCTEHHNQREMRFTHTYPEGQQPHWGFMIQTGQFFCFHDANNPFIRIDTRPAQTLDELPAEESEIIINFPYPVGQKSVYSRRRVVGWQIRHDNFTRTFHIRLFRMAEQFQ